MLDVIIRLGDTVFQSREVKGAVCSGDLEFESKARGVNFWGAGWLLFAERVIELPAPYVDGEGSDHKRRWSPEVASRSVDCF